MSIKGQHVYSTGTSNIDTKLS